MPCSNNDIVSVVASNVLVKQPSEKRHFSMDFAELMTDGETIETSSPAPDVSYECNTGATDLTITEVTVSGQTVLFWIEGGTHGGRYRVEVTLTTSGGQILSGDGVLMVTDR